jgi:hypothetical protein
MKAPQELVRRTLSLFIFKIGILFIFKIGTLRHFVAALSSHTVKITPLRDWSGKTGDKALSQVQFLASKVAGSTPTGGSRNTRKKKKASTNSVAGTGGDAFAGYKSNIGAPVKSSRAPDPSAISQSKMSLSSNQEEQVWNSLANLEFDSEWHTKVTFSLMQCAAVVSHNSSIVVLSMQCNHLIL